MSQLWPDETPNIPTYTELAQAAGVDSNGIDALLEKVPQYSSIQVQSLEQLEKETTQKHSFVVSILSTLPRTLAKHALYEWVTGYKTSSVYVRYIGVRREIRHMAMLQQTLNGNTQDIIDNEKYGATLELLERLERSLVFAQQSIGDKNNTIVSSNGILASLLQRAPQQVIDMHGKPLNSDTLQKIHTQLCSGYTAKDRPLPKLFVNDYAYQNIQYDNDNEHILVNNTDKLNGYRYNDINMSIKRNILLQAVDANYTNYESSMRQDKTPMLNMDSCTLFAIDDATSNIRAGDYYYSIGVITDTDESAPILIPKELHVRQGQSVVLHALAAPLKNTELEYHNPNTGYRIYRGTTQDVLKHRWIGEVAANSKGTAFEDTEPGEAHGPLHYIDRNRFDPLTPGMALGFLAHNDVIELANFLPMLRWPLPVTSNGIPWIQTLYYALAVKQPKNIIMYINIGENQDQSGKEA